MSKKLNVSKKFLNKEYIKNRKSTVDIAKELECSSTTVQKYLKIYNISIRNPSEAQLDKHIGSKNEMFGRIGKLNSQYIDGRTSQKNYMQIYYQINKKRFSKKRRDYHRNRLHRDLNYRIKCNIRTRLYNAIKNNHKSATTIILLGCSIEYFKQHLKKQFKKGMNWDNYGKWHIDHIIPCDSFDLSKASEQKKCFHYSNLQPLWAIDNLIKGKKYNPQKP